MKTIIAFLCSIILCGGSVSADERCFIAKENGKVLKSEGDCDRRYAPESTFKIALSLMGFDSGILKNANDPSWSLPKDSDSYINVCKSDHNPRTWMRDSCLWYSRILTTKLGMEKFQNYVTKFSYGNIDLSGGLINAWISSSLEISPNEQIAFLEKVLNHKLPVNKVSYDMTKKLIFVQEMSGGWTLYGKSGNGTQVNKLQHGWFIGYIERDKRQIVFAYHIVDDKKQDTFASLRARGEALIKLFYIINDLEK
jgi:beta-lactamase class D